MYTARGLFEKDKITFTAQMTFQVSFYGPVEVGNICIVFIIIDFSITNFLFQHPSFLRLFTPLEVKELSIIESGTG